MLILLSLVACSGPYGAPQGSRVTVFPEDFTASFGTAFYDEDGLGFVAYCEAYVEGPNDFEETVPINNVEVVAQSQWPGVYLLPEDAVNSVSTLEDGCAEDPSGEGCDVFIDTDSGEYYEITGEYAYDDTLRPNLMYATTNNRGVVPFFLFFDSLPYSTSDTDFMITYSIQVDNTEQSVVVQALDETTE